MGVLGFLVLDLSGPGRTGAHVLGLALGALRGASSAFFAFRELPFGVLFSVLGAAAGFSGFVVRVSVCHFILLGKVKKSIQILQSSCWAMSGAKSKGRPLCRDWRGIKGSRGSCSI